MGRPGNVPLVPAAHFVYERKAHDRFWAFLFAVFWLACIAGGVYSIQHRNTKFTLDPKYVADPKNCPYPDKARGLLEGPEDPSFDAADFWRSASVWLGVSVAGCVLLGAAFLHLFKRYADVMTRATIYTQVAVPLVFAVSVLVAGQPIMSLPFLLMAGLAALVFWLWRGEIALASRLLGVSAHGLVANPHLITTAVILNLLSLLPVAPILVFQAFAIMNGSFIPNPDRQGAAQCVNSAGEAVPCCTWQPEQWALGYVGAGALLILWTLLLANQIRVFVISGTIAQWYFSPVGVPPTSSYTTRSLKYALGPSFGSLCFSSLILTITETLRQATQNAQDQNENADIITFCFYLCVQMIFSLVEYLTKFATVFMAITGKAFLAAGREVTSLLMRNLLNAFASTVWFTPLVIQLACFSLSVAWGLLTGAAYYYLRPHGLETHHGVNAVVLGGIAGVVTLFVLTFLGGVLLSVLDATFVCWAIDRDTQTVSHPEVYEVFMTVPIKTPQGTVVEQPGGGLAYGAEQQPLAPGEQQAGAYQPPVIHRAPLV